jgi:hypothetical protein
MTLLPLADLVVEKPRPETTLALIPAYWDHAREMVESYIFTDTIRQYFTQILESVATGTGQGFWVQAEYGAGKTHFLAALAALLANSQDGLWETVHNAEIRNYRRRLEGMRLFPVIVSLRGMGEADAFAGRTLLDVILEEGFRQALEKAGLEGQIQITAAEDYITWLERDTTPELRQAVEAYVRSKTGQGFREYRDYEGAQALARLIADYCSQNAMRPRIAGSVKDRLAHIYRQLVELKPTRYDGVLVVIDEYEGWEKSHSSPAARANDEDVLETLAYLLPRDLGQRVYTVVASQSAVPAKLRGSQGGDRFIQIPLLASQNERDYDVIVSRRVRGLNENRLPEISEHYQHYRQHFDFAKDMREAEFRDVFPFQPRCFEIARRITARELPTARSGIAIFYEAVNDRELLARTSLIRVADLLRSPHLTRDCLSAPVYKTAHGIYKDTRQSLHDLELEPEDMRSAEDILDTLFLWYLAYQDIPRPMSLKDLAQATLTTSDVLRAEDNVAYVLDQMRPLSQVLFESQQASFVPVGGGPRPTKIFEKYRRDALKNEYSVSAEWSKGLFLTTQETRGAAGMFSGFTADQAQPQRVTHRHLDYAGQVIVASRWQLDWGMPLAKDDQHFRLVIMTAEAAESLKPETLQDPRIAVVYPAALGDEAQRAAADYLAWQAMSDDYAPGKRPDKDAEEVRTWLERQRSTYLDNLLRTQLRQYQNGKVVTRDSLAIVARDAFGAAGNDRRIAAVVEPLLAAAYPQLPLDWEHLRGDLRAAEVNRVFDGYFGGTPSTAEKAAARNFGAGLRLSLDGQPEHFSPQAASALDMIAELLAERKGEVPVWRIYEKLSGPPYGLPYPLIQLYLLAFVRRGDPRAEIILKRDHRLRLRNGQPFPANRLTTGNVIDLDFKPGLERSFDVLAAAAGPSWNDAVGFAQEVFRDLHASHDPSEIEEQTRRLQGELTRLGEAVVVARRHLGILAQNLGDPLPEKSADILDNLASLAGTAESGYQVFYEKASATYATADDLRDQQRAFAALHELSDLAPEIATVDGYLDAVQLRPADRELIGDKTAIRGQLKLEVLAAQPNLWPSIRAQFDSFRTRYRIAYQKHHRDTYVEMQRLNEELTDAPRRLEALALLNGIHELGSPEGGELPGRLRSLLERVRLCTVPFLNLTLEDKPVCACGLKLTDELPADDVKGFLRDLERALQTQQRRLASEAIRRVLTKSSEGRVTAFVQAVQTANMAALVDVMDEELAVFIQVLLAEQEVGTSNADVLRRFADAYPTLEEADLPKAMREFERLLRESFDAARRANPDKKTVRLTLR